MTVSIFFTNLVVPLNLCIALVLIGAIFFVFRHRKTGALIAAAGICWALFWSLPASTLWAGGRLEQLYPYHPPSQLPPTQAIVVLGGNTANNRHNWFRPYDKNTALSRVETAAALYEAKRAPIIVLSGAALEGRLSEAEVMARTLREQGIPEQALILETASTNTHENGVFTAAKLEEMGIDRILLVTSALHMPRAMGVFQKLGITAVAAPSRPQILVPRNPQFSFWLPDLRTFEASRSIIKEYVGLLVYWLRGWI